MLIITDNFKVSSLKAETKMIFIPIDEINAKCKIENNKDYIAIIENQKIAEYLRKNFNINIAYKNENYKINKNDLILICILSTKQEYKILLENNPELIEIEYWIAFEKNN